ncbi:hypothetical protein HDU76_001775 [Blyttiomyces sp. JEL0837]|nr:hypothetical protein HDU76_001775 [Blyttiomyces sp. JEL0837]
MLAKEAILTDNQAWYNGGLILMLGDGVPYDVLISDCTNAGTVFANTPGTPQYHNLITQTVLPPFALDFTKSKDGMGFMPLMNMTNVGINVNVGPHVSTQDLTFTQVDQTIVVQGVDPATGNLFPFAQVVAKTPAQGTASTGKISLDLTNVYLDGTLGGATIAIQNKPYLTFLSALIGPAYPAGYAIPYFVRGNASTTINAGVQDTSAPNKPYTFCLQNIVFGAATRNDVGYVSTASTIGAFNGSAIVANTDTTKSGFTIVSATDDAITFSHKLNLAYHSDLTLTFGDIQTAFVHSNAPAAIPKTTLGTTTIRSVVLPGVAKGATKSYTHDAITVVNNPLATDATAAAYNDFITNLIGFASNPFVPSTDPIANPPTIAQVPHPDLTPSFQGSLAVKNLPALLYPLSLTNFDTVLNSNKNPLIKMSNPVQFQSNAFLGTGDSSDANLNITISNPFDVSLNIHGIQVDLLYPGGNNADFALIANSTLIDFGGAVVVGKGQDVLLPQLGLAETRIPSTLLALTSYLNTADAGGRALYLNAKLVISFDQMKTKTYTVSYQQIVNAVLVQNGGGGGFGGGFGGFAKEAIKLHF